MYDVTRAIDQMVCWKGAILKLKGKGEEEDEKLLPDLP